MLVSLMRHLSVVSLPLQLASFVASLHNATGHLNRAMVILSAHRGGRCYRAFVLWVRECHC
jgi:hypothetical protein